MLLYDCEGKLRRFFPRVCLFKGDLMDAAATTLVSGSLKGRYPDTMFLVPTNQLASLADFPLRTESHMLQARRFQALQMKGGLVPRHACQSAQLECHCDYRPAAWKCRRRPTQPHRLQPVPFPKQVIREAQDKADQGDTAGALALLAQYGLSNVFLYNGPTEGVVRLCVLCRWARAG